MMRYIVAPVLLTLLFINMPVHEVCAGFIAGQPENVVFDQLEVKDQPLQLRKPALQPIKRPNIKPLPNAAEKTMIVPQQQDQVQFVLQDPLRYAQLGSEQYQQGQSSYPPTGVQGTTGGSQGSTPATSDMQRRTGGQGRTNTPGVQQMPMGQQPAMQGGQQMMQQGVQQMPMGQQPMMPGGQGMPMQQDPSSMQMQQPGGGQQMMQQGGQGGCKIQLSEDRTTISLIDSSGQEAEHVSLGQDRVQKVFKSPDGSWNVVVFKVRQRQEFGAIAINMMECDAQEARDIRAVPAQIEFQGPEMVLTYPGNASERYALSNKNLP